MKSILLVVLFSFMLVFTGLNVILIWDGSGIGHLLSVLVSLVGIPFALGVCFILPGNKWLLFPRAFALVTFALNLASEEYSLLQHLDPLLLIANSITVILLITSIVIAHRLPREELTLQ